MNFKRLENFSVSYPAFQNMASARKSMIALAEELIKDEEIKANGIDIVGRGTSGLTLSVLLQISLSSYNVESNVKYVRKPHEENHGHSSSVWSSRSIIVVDDIMASGDTIEIIGNKLLEEKLQSKVVYLAVGGATDHEKLIKRVFPNLKQVYY